MSRYRPQPTGRDAGAALVLVIGFTLMIGAISAGLASVADSTMSHRTTLELSRNHQYAADAAVEMAITQARSQSCSSPATTRLDNTVNGSTIRVEWQNTCTSVTSSDGSLYPQRNAIFAACIDTGFACATADVILRAQVNFEPASGPVTRTVVQAWSVHR